MTPPAWSSAWRLLLPDPFMPHITRPGVLGSRTKSGVKHHKAVFHPRQVLQVNGFLVLDHARTAVDIAREHGSPHGVVACDAALRLGAVVGQLERALLPMRNWPHVKRARAAVDLADPGAESLGETLARMLVEELGIGRPQTQFGITDGRREAWCDLRVGRHVFEFDGRIKYQRRQDGGVATRARTRSSGARSSVRTGSAASAWACPGSSGPTSGARTVDGHVGGWPVSTRRPSAGTAPGSTTQARVHHPSSPPLTVLDRACNAPLSGLVHPRRGAPDLGRERY